jgi:pyruvate-formate lyase-activating enzyme
MSLETLKIMLSLFNLLLKYKPIMDINKRQIKFINDDNIKCCLIFYSSKEHVTKKDYIKRICGYIGSKQNFAWTTNSNHPILPLQQEYDYVVKCIIINIEQKEKKEKEIQLQQLQTEVLLKYENMNKEYEFQQERILEREKKNNIRTREKKNIRTREYDKRKQQ